MLAGGVNGRLRVLVVDDDIDTTDSGAMLLRLLGHDVETASSGPEAIARTSSFQPQIAVLDLAMPRMDGYETARQIQRLVLPKPPVIVALSGYGDAEARRKSAEAGFDLHLTKPVEPDIFEHFHLLVEDLDDKLDRLRELVQQQAQILPQFMKAHLQMGYSLLQVIHTTEDDATRDRCRAKAQQLYARMNRWMATHPNLDHMRKDVEDLVERLWRAQIR